MDFGLYSGKLLLFAVILMSLGLAGFALGAAYRQRARLIRQILQALEHLESGIRLGRPISEALADCGIFSGMSGTVRSKGCAGAWEEQRDTARFAAMEPPERELLDDFWQAAGRTDRRSQLLSLSETSLALKKLGDAAERTAAQQGRLFGSLGILLGIAVVVLLW